MKRREFITLFGNAAAAWPLAARAQASRVRVGFVDFAGENDPNGSDRARAFKQGLERLGWTPTIDYYWSVFNVDGQIVKVTRLVAGQTATVLQLPAATLDHKATPQKAARTVEV